MPDYPLQPAKDPLAIEECQYAIGTEVKFTKFTSCMGLFCKIENSNNVIGIHLVIIDGKHQKFTEADIPAVQKILTDNHAQLDTGWVVGCLDNWPADIKNGFLQIFEDDMAQRELAAGKGWYSAKVESGAVKVSFKS